MSNESSEYDPFNPEPDGDRSLTTLIRSLEFAQRFTLLFVVCNSTEQRNGLMDEVERSISPKAVWRVPVTTEIRNLYHLFQETVPEPAPDVVFVYGLEFWLSGAVRPRSIPLLRNLNVARDSFPLVTDCPVIFFIPQYVLNAIADAAPDFFSVRSGLFVFPLDETEREKMQSDLARLGQIELTGFRPQERDARIEEMQGLLSEVRSLPPNKRNRQDEAVILNQLAGAYRFGGYFAEAESLYQEALNIYRDVLPQKHPDIATSLNNLAYLYRSLNRLAEAEPLLTEALNIYREVLPERHGDLATSFNNLAELYWQQKRPIEAEPLFKEALKIDRAVLPQKHPNTASVLNDLAIVYHYRNQLAEAETFYIEALDIRREVLPEKHPDIAQSLNNLAYLYRMQNRLAEAEPLYKEALDILRESLGEDHPNTQLVRSNYERLRELYGPP